ncbi:MAG: hypothetical protein WBA84_03905 [Carnobacterium sp.]|uniref:hypothetical protein n=1 Tax=Carnobacterium sp. TaxID=48221 RepID=UPI003C742659
MSIYDKTTKEFKEMLEREEYKSENYELHEYDGAFEMLADYGNIKTLFDDLVKELGEIPTQQEYVEAGVKRAKLFFTPRKDFGKGNIKYRNIDDGRLLRVGKGLTEKTHTFYWNDEELKKAVRKRLSRTYPSMLAEVSLIIAIKEVFPDFKVFANPVIDSVMGVDAVVISKEADKTVYIHVTGKSYGSSDYLNQKAKRKGYAEDIKGKSHFYERKSLKGHIHLTFSKFKDSVSTEIVNGNPIFKAEHIHNVLTVALEQEHIDSSKAEQLNELHNWLIKNEIKADKIESWGI